MKRRIVLILCIGLLTASVIGCANNVEQTTLPEGSAQVEQTPSPTPTPTLKPTLKPVIRPSLEEIETHLKMKDQLILIEDEQLWEKMHIQLVQYEGIKYAVIGNIEKTVTISILVGSSLSQYKIIDLNEDGEYEMVGYYDWGSGIVRSTPFVLKADGGYFAGRESDKIEQRLSNGDEVVMPMYGNLQIAEDGKSLIADAKSSLSGQEYSQVKIYYEDGKYIFELK